MIIGLAALTIFTLIVIFMGIRTVRPTQRALIERMGKYQKFAGPGMHIIIPFIDSIHYVNITEMMAEIKKQEIITADKLNAAVAAQVYFKVRDTEEGVKNSQYAVYDVHEQIEALITTTLRNVMGTMSLAEGNSKRNEINNLIKEILVKETAAWGVDIVRAELMQIDAPADVQAQMNQVVIAANKKTAALDFATAQETEADGKKRAAIKEAEGRAQALIAEAEGKAKAIKMVNDAAKDSLTGPALDLRKIEAFEKALMNNTKIILPSTGSLINVVGELLK